MREYELIYVVQPDATDERLKQIHDRVDAAITGGQGMVLLRDDWGKRKLSYEIAKFQKGHYFHLAMLGDGKFIAEMERLLRIDPDVLRFLTVLVAEEVPDIDARVERAVEQAAEQARRREEREKLEAERERIRAEVQAREADARPADEGSADKPVADEGKGAADKPVADESKGAADEPVADEGKGAADEPVAAKAAAGEPVADTGGADKNDDA